MAADATSLSHVQDDDEPHRHGTSGKSYWTTSTGLWWGFGTMQLNAEGIDGGSSMSTILDVVSV